MKSTCQNTKITKTKTGQESKIGANNRWKILGHPVQSQTEWYHQKVVPFPVRSRSCIVRTFSANAPAFWSYKNERSYFESHRPCCHLSSGNSYLWQSSVTQASTEGNKYWTSLVFKWFKCVRSSNCSVQ